MSAPIDHRERVPVPEFRDPRVELLPLALEPGGQRGGVGDTVVDGVAQAHGTRRSAVLERGLCLAQQPGQPPQLGVLRLMA
ncbi:MAG: hypothetical protein MUF57_10060, partial [Gammaproteobacteria bacterium]|nr:hypothetical protein [Gammaproteobacteria bacterium]